MFSSNIQNCINLLFSLFFSRQAIEANKKDRRAKEEDDLSSCILMINLDSARELPVSMLTFHQVSAIGVVDIVDLTPPDVFT